MAKENKDISRFNPSGLNQHFIYENHSFSEYVLAVREMLEKARLDLTEENREKIIDANSPYEWHPESPHAINPETGRYRVGFLLVHGLFDSPYMFESLAQLWHKQSALIRAILLPGHGTVPGDLKIIDREDWLQATLFGIKSFANQVDKLFVVGFSTGGLLALLHAYEQPIDGLILFAPAIGLRTQFAIFSTIQNFMTKTIGGITWYIKSDDLDYAKYQSVNLEPARQVYLLTQQLQDLAEVRTLDTPMFIVASSDDEAIAETSVFNYFGLQPNPLNRLLYYTTSFVEDDDPRIIQISGNMPEHNVISFSHVCLPIAPNHPHYGINGDFIEDHRQVRRILGAGNGKNQTQQVQALGALSRENLKRYNLKRLTYNPDFDNMFTRIEEFIQRVCQHKKNNDLYSIPYLFHDNSIAS